MTVRSRSAPVWRSGLLMLPPTIPRAPVQPIPMVYATGTPPVNPTDPIPVFVTGTVLREVTTAVQESAPVTKKACGRKGNDGRSQFQWHIRVEPSVLRRDLSRRMGDVRSGVQLSTVEHLQDAAMACNLLQVEWANEQVNLWTVELMTTSLLEAGHPRMTWIRPL